MDDFVDSFTIAYELIVLGVLKRIDEFREETITEAMPDALRLGLAKMGVLNLQYDLFVDGKGVLPTDDYLAFQMLLNPVSEIINKLPEKLQCEFSCNSFLASMNPIIESDLSGNYFLTQEGEYYINTISRVRESKDASDSVSEYMSQLIFEELLRGGNYVEKRSFMIDKENTYVLQKRLDRSDEQNVFISKYSELFPKVYKEVSSEEYFICSRCGCIAVPDSKGHAICQTSLCRNKMSKLKRTELTGSIYILNSNAIRFIYTPGILESKIFDVVRKSQNVDSYKLWPGEDADSFDTWDMEFTLKNGETYLVDAKDVQNPEWIIADKCHLVSGKSFLYVVPNNKNKQYMEKVNKGLKGKGVRCLRLSEFENLIRE